jgi:hypothetical protein
MANKPYKLGRSDQLRHFAPKRSRGGRGGHEREKRERERQTERERERETERQRERERERGERERERLLFFSVVVSFDGHGQHRAFIKPFDRLKRCFTPITITNNNSWSLSICVCEQAFRVGIRGFHEGT